MIKKLRIKFLIISILVSFLSLFSVCAFINGSSYYSLTSSIKESFDIVFRKPIDDGPPSIPNDSSSNDAEVYYKLADETNPPDEGGGASEENFVHEQYFIVSFDVDGTVKETNFHRIFAISETEGIAFATEIYNSGSTFGRNGKYFYATNVQNDVTYVAVLDAKLQLDSFNSGLVNSIIGFSIIFVAISIALFIGSKIIFKSTEDAYKKQKEFITNASHELKTPVTVISADLDILEMDGINNEWTDSIRAELKKLTKMTNELVILSRLSEENKNNYPFSKVDISKELHEAINSFSSSFLTKKLKLVEDVEDNIIMEASPKLMQELISIFLENASKYALDSGELLISLKNNDKKKIELIFSNDMEEDNKINVDNIFERFYRSPNAKKEGSGIGLAMAKEIVSLHKGSIKATIEKNKIKFIILF